MKALRIWSLFLLGTALHLAADAAAEIPDLTKQPGFLGSEMIFPDKDRPTPACHASTIVETPAGLVAAWFGGRHEGSPDVGIWLSQHHGKGWSPPVEVANGVMSPAKREPCWNPVLFRPHGGPLMLFYKVGPNPEKWWGMLMTSDDDGKTWHKPWKLGTHPAIGQLIGPSKNKPLALKDGAIICPSSSEHDGWRVHFEVTRDLGKTWGVIGPLHDDKNFAAIQPSILTYPGGRMQALCRSRHKVITESWSQDHGRTWSALAATSLPNPNSGIDAVTLADGRQLLVCNHTTAARSPLNVAVSADGKTWNNVLLLENQTGEFSYPAVIQTKDGLVHITYTYLRQTIKHVTLDPSRFSP